MNSKHRKTLAAVFADPVSGTIEWAAIEALLVATGCRIVEGNGSRVKFVRDGEIESFTGRIPPRRQSGIRSARRARF